MKQSNSRSAHRKRLNAVATGVRRVLAQRAFPGGNDIPLDRNINGRENLYFATNQEREASEFAVFGEASFDANRPRSVGLSLGRRF